MCRMMVAVGRFEMAPLLEGLRAMAANANAGHDHEFRGRGEEFQHDCGWGVAWNEDGRFERRVSRESCVDDPTLDGLSTVSTDLAILHARRTPNRETIDERNCHPFIEERSGEVWAFCHNGAVNDVSQLGTHGTTGTRAPIDSELLFRFLLERLDADDPTGSVASALGEIVDFTCLNSFLATPGAAHVYSRAPSDTTRPRYYTLWLGRDGRSTVVSSEPLRLSGTEWAPLPGGSALRLSV